MTRAWTVMSIEDADRRGGRWAALANEQRGENKRDRRQQLHQDVERGPAVSLNGSPTVSPTTAAAWASEPLPRMLGSNAFLPSDEVTSTFQVTDDFTKIYGKHTFKMGFEWQHVKFSTLQPPWSRGEFDYGSVYTDVPNVRNGNTGRAQFLLSPTSRPRLSRTELTTLAAPRRAQATTACTCPTYPSLTTGRITTAVTSTTIGRSHPS